MDLARPLICFGLEPSVPVSIGADVATKEAVARHNVCRVNDAAKDGTGCLLAAWGDNEDAFPRVQVVAIDFALLFEANEELFQFFKLPACISKLSYRVILFQDK